MRCKALGAIAALPLCACAAYADDVIENEMNGGAVNNELLTAQPISGASFTSASNWTIFGNLPTATVTGRGGVDDVDFYSFSAGPGIAYFDIDFGAFDSSLALFDSAGNILAGGDDSFPVDPGSGMDRDAFIGIYTLPKAGTYFLAVSDTTNGANGLFSGTDFFELTRPDGFFGGFGFVGVTGGDSSFPRSGAQEGAEYTLHITIPAPASALALAGVLPVLRRRRVK